MMNAHKKMKTKCAKIAETLGTKAKDQKSVSEPKLKAKSSKML
jgi:hypothetical protein